MPRSRRFSATVARAALCSARRLKGRGMSISLAEFCRRPRWSSRRKTAGPRGVGWTLITSKMAEPRVKEWDIRCTVALDQGTKEPLSQILRFDNINYSFQTDSIGEKWQHFPVLNPAGDGWGAGVSPRLGSPL